MLPLVIMPLLPPPPEPPLLDAVPPLPPPEPPPLPPPLLVAPELFPPFARLIPPTPGSGAEQAIIAVMDPTATANTID
jgi:hypothetical protein